MKSTWVSFAILCILALFVVTANGTLGLSVGQTMQSAVTPLSPHQQGQKEYCGDYELPGKVNDTLGRVTAIFENYQAIQQKWQESQMVYTGLVQRSHLQGDQTTSDMGDALRLAKQHYAAMACVARWADQNIAFINNSREKIIAQARSREKSLTAKLQTCRGSQTQSDDCLQSVNELQKIKSATQLLRQHAGSRGR